MPHEECCLLYRSRSMVGQAQAKVAVAGIRVR